MQNKRTVFVLALVIVFVFSGCLPQEMKEPKKEQQSQLQKENNTGEAEELYDESEKVKAVYIGRIDPDFVEILHEGDFETYAFGRDVEFAIEGDGIESYSAVDITINIDGQGRKQIESLALADPPGLGNAPEMKAQGEVDAKFGASVCMIEGDPYYLPYQSMISTPESVAEGDYIDLEYYVDGYGRNVITWYEKIFTESGRFESKEGILMAIKLVGNPDGIEAKEYLLSAEAEETMESLQLKMGEEIRFHYVVEQEGVKKIVSLERME